MNIDPNPGRRRKEKRMNIITKAMSVAVLVTLGLALGARAAELPSAAQVLKETGVDAGLAVVVGTTDGVLEAALTRGQGQWVSFEDTQVDRWHNRYVDQPPVEGGRLLVQGLALSDDAAAKARRHIFEQKLYGLASVSRVPTAATLPYYDRLVNLLVADLDALGKDAPPRAEIDRVLGYEGVAYLKQDGKWSKTVKPTPKEVDTWTHAFYDPSCSKVSRDLLAGPANAVRWINGPAGLRNNTGAPRTSDGVFIQIVPETREGGKGTSLLARDVNSGVLLWKQPGSFLANESLVAIGGRVYTHQLILGQSKPAPQPLRGWNIRTGKLEKTYEAGLLIARRPGQDELCQVLVVGGDLVQVNTSEIRVLDIETGQLRWKKEGSFHRAAIGGSTIFLSMAKPDKPDREPGQRVKPVVWGVAVTALELASGKPLWTKDARDFNLEFLDPNEAILSDLWYA